MLRTDIFKCKNTRSFHFASIRNDVTYFHSELPHNYYQCLFFCKSRSLIINEYIMLVSPIGIKYENLISHVMTKAFSLPIK